jgi:acyl carrier protein
MEDKKVEKLLADALGMPVEQVNDDLAMREVEAWDSLKHMELIVALEESFQIQLTFDEIVAMQSVGQIKTVLKQRGVIA